MSNPVLRPGKYVVWLMTGPNGGLGSSFGGAPVGYLSFSTRIEYGYMELAVCDAWPEAQARLTEYRSLEEEYQAILAGRSLSSGIRSDTLAPVSGS